MPAFTSELFRFAVFPMYNDAIRFLAETLADPEKWDFDDIPVPRYPILKNYLEFTFRKLKQEQKIVYSSGGRYACFNTGLVTDNLEDIYAFFEAYRNRVSEATPPYCFKAFLKKSDNRILCYFSHNLPDVANFFEKPELLIFNPKCDLVPDIDHILKDNIARFPQHMQNSGDAALRRQLTGAIADVKKRVRTNYKLAVPQYYDGRIQLLLPLSLGPGTGVPDLALVVHRLNEKMYTARTCLTLRMAYNNARLIVKPQSNWLKP